MHSIEKIEKGFRWAALPVALISAWFTFCFAYSTMADPYMGFLLGVALAICALCSGYVWTVRQAAIQHGVSPAVAAILLGAGMMFTGTDAFTNLGSLLWQRTSADTQAKFQNTSFEDARVTVRNYEAEIKVLAENLDSLKSKNPWVTSTSAEGLEAQIPAMEEAIRQETKRGGCGPKCLGLTKELASLQERVALAKQKDEHSKKLEAAKRGLEKAQAAAKEQPPVVSATASQAGALAGIFTISLKPSEHAQEWTDRGAGIVLALFLTFGPMAMNWIGFGGWRSSPKAVGAMPTVPASASVPSIHREVIREQPINYVGAFIPSISSNVPAAALKRAA